MCQLLGISANRAVSLEFSFQEWRHRGCSNPHGYGFAHWQRGCLEIVKAASSLYAAAEADVRRLTRLRSSIFLCHVRLKSVGPQDGNNTHPFCAEWRGSRFAFAHNGTLRDADDQLRLETLQPRGATDSERALLWLMEHLAEPSGPGFSRDLQQLAAHVARLGRFNFLLSDGDTLWAYADHSLYFTERHPPYGGHLVRLKDDGYTISLAHIKAPDENAVLIATEPLTDERGWQRVCKGELLAVRGGVVQERLPRS
jgi:predicted glutamine amidotransferase